MCKLNWKLDYCDGMVCLINSNNSDDDVMVWQGMAVQELKL